MKIAWLFPVDQKCGISYYSHDYVNALAESTDVEIFDIYECLANIPSYSDRLNSFDIIHIQYETSFFLKGNSKKFKGLCGKIKKPVVVRQHILSMHHRVSLQMHLLCMPISKKRSF
jgi:hypothetical protein